MSKNNLFPFSFLNISAPTSAGKTTLIATFRQRFPTYLGFSKSATTRVLTVEEIEKGLYENVSEEEFKSRIDKGLFLEWNRLKSNNHCYGTLMSEYYRIKHAGQTIIADLDNNGARQVKEKLGDEVFNVYLMVSENELRRRMNLPGSRVRDNPEERLRYALEENSYAMEHKKTIFDCMLPYDHRAPNEAVSIIINQMRKKHLLLKTA